MFAIIVRDKTGDLDLRVADNFQAIGKVAAGDRILRVVPMCVEAVEEEQRYREALERIRRIPKPASRHAKRKRARIRQPEGLHDAGPMKPHV